MSDNFEARLEELERKLQRERDRQDVITLATEYFTMWNQEHIAECGKYFAYEMPDVSFEVADRGNYVGKEAIEKLFKVEYQIPYNEGALLSHHMCSPVVEVAEDGKTAEGTWWLIGPETMMDKDDQPDDVWCFCHNAFDFIKIDGKWKIWHIHWYVQIKCDYEKGWSKDWEKWTTQWIDRSTFRIADDVKVTKHEGYNTSYHNPHTPASLQHAFPAPPLPYKTWKNSNWIFRLEPQLLPQNMENFDPEDPEYKELLAAKLANK